MKHPLPLLLAFLAGCALTSKAAPVEIRYFSPEGFDARRAAPPVRRDESPDLRLGRVTASDYLYSRIVVRRSAFEVESYDDLRWTERPDAYLQRYLSRALFEQRPLVQGFGGPLPSLDADLVTFEEVRRGAVRSGRVQIDYVLRDDRGVLARGRITAEREAAAGGGMERVVAAIAAALDEAASRLADGVAARISGPH